MQYRRLVRRALGTSLGTALLAAAVSAQETANPGDVEDEIEEIIVTTTRRPTRLADTATRIEVIDQEELEEKVAMSPGDVVMLLSETSGLRVQMTAPGLGAANVRIQGLRGQYSQILADGLPLYGGQTGSIGLLQPEPLGLRASTARPDFASPNSSVTFRSRRGVKRHPRAVS